MRVLRNYIELCRLHMLGLGIQCVVGALTVTGASLPVAAFAPLFAVHAITIAWGFAHNDYNDYELDRLAPALQNRVLVRGDVSRPAALKLVLVLLGLSVLLTYAMWPGPVPLSLYVVVALCVVAYNRYSKRFAGSDLLFATGGSTLIILGAATVLPGHDLGQLPRLTWLVFAISFIDHINFNAVLGGIKDVVTDKAQHCNTLACRNIAVADDGTMMVGVAFRITALAGTALMIGLSLLPFTWASYPSYAWQIALCVMFAAATLYYTYRFVSMERHDRDIIEKLARQREMAAKSLMLCMWTSWIGPLWTLIIFAVPATSFLLFNTLMNGNPFRLPKDF